MASENIKHLTEDDFDEAVSKGITLVDFYAEWCGPCKMMEPVLEELAQEDNGALVAKVNIDENQDLTRRFGVTSVPTIVVLQDGEVKQRVVGLQNKEALNTLIKSVG